MRRVLISRQPIYRADKTEFGYELLYDLEGGDAIPPAVGLKELAAGRLAFINVDHNVFYDNYCAALPPRSVVLEILEPIQPDEAILQRVRELKAKGYRIAFPHFVCSERYHPLLQLADFVRLNVTTSDFASIERSIAAMRQHSVQPIAERVETNKQFNQCKELGFEFFQGHFFCRPQVSEGERIPLHRLEAIHFTANLNNPALKFHEIEQVISQDAALCAKLMRYVNSAVCGLNHKVESIKHAIMLVGHEKIRNWASVLLCSGFQHTPRDVIVTGVTRARMCEQLAIKLGIESSDQLFVIGLFSILDAVLDQPLGKALTSLPLTQKVRDAILYHEGELGAVLRCVVAYERREWFRAQTEIELEPDTIRQAYQEALAWSLRSLNSFAA